MCGRAEDSGVELWQGRGGEGRREGRRGWSSEEEGQRVECSIQRHERGEGGKRHPQPLDAPLHKTLGKQGAGDGSPGNCLEMVSIQGNG